MQNWVSKKKKKKRKKKVNPFFPNFLGRSEKGKQTSFFLGLMWKKALLTTFGEYTKAKYHGRESAFQVAGSRVCHQT